MELLLIRHALPVRIEIPEGEPADPPLSETGIGQAARLAHWLEPEPLDALYASPMRRARETAEPLGSLKRLDVRLEPGVVEFDHDSEIYIPLEELKEKEPERWQELIQSYALRDMAEFRKLTVSTLERIVRDHPASRVAVVCHGGVINAWAGHVLGIDQPMFFEPAYTSIHRTLVSSAGPRTLVSLNESGHLLGTR